MRWTRGVVGLVLVLLAGSATLANAGEGPGDPAAEAFFEAKVRPLLVARCLECHGEGAKPKGGLRLTSREAVLVGGDSGAAAVPGRPGESALVEAIHYVDEPKMPPKGKLPLEEVAILERWVELGLPWPVAVAGTVASKGTEFRLTDEHRRFWSFQPVKAVPPPSVRQEAWPINPIDRFILAKLEEQGLTPSPPADPATLLRRVTFDLTGLPPTPDEVAGFVADRSPGAYEKAVDRLLAAPTYGQRWGRHWLDVARYADSRDARGVGSSDDITEAWRYRDWVVGALNRDLPYNQFVTHQIAGDLLPGPTPGDINPEGMVATGLLTIGEWGTGDADKEKMLTDIVADQVDVVTRGFLGLTVACARCHDHKFDPIPASDYYGLAGIFFSTRILPDPGAKTNGSPMLRTPIATKAQRQAIADHQRNQAAAEAALAKVRDSALEGVARSLASRLRQILQAAVDGSASSLDDLPPSVPRKFARLLGLETGTRLTRPMPEVQGRQGVQFWSGASDPPWIGVNATGQPVALGSLTLPPRSVNLHPGPKTPAAIRWRSPIAGAVRVGARISDADPNGGNGVTAAISLRPQGRAAKELVSAVVENAGNRDLQGAGLDRVEVQVGDVVELAVTPRGEYSFDTTTVSLKIEQIDAPTASWDVTADLLPDLLVANPHADRLGHPAVWELVELADHRAARPLADHPGWAEWDARGSIEAFARQVEADPRWLGALVGPGGPLRPDLPDEAWTLAEPTKAEIARSQAEVDRRKASPPPPIPLAIVAVEGGVPRSVYEGFHDARIQVRGDYRRLGPVVPRHFPLVVAGETPPVIPSGSGRLELARWVASPGNPLTPRVMVNRLWQGHFGAGLVRTSSNFGKLGEAPSHPELLDWLADRLVAEGWSLKQIHRLIVTSQTYRQSSRANPPEAHRLDPDNRFLSRMERRRLEAEAVRDALLAVSGRLDPSLGGPSTRDFASPRRTLYQMTIRSDRSSFGPLFDAADSTAMVDRRVVSTVAPQALFLMNHPFVIDQAQALATRLQKEGVDDEGRIRRAYALLYARPPTPEEISIGRDLLDQVAKAEGSPERAWPLYAQVLLCSNEFIYVD